MLIANVAAPRAMEIMRLGLDCAGIVGHVALFASPRASSHCQRRNSAARIKYAVPELCPITEASFPVSTRGHPISQCSQWQCLPSFELGGSWIHVLFTVFHEYTAQN